MKNFSRAALFSFLIFLCFTIPAHSQNTIDESLADLPKVYHNIERAYQNGRLTLDQKILFQFYTVHNRDKLPADYGISDSEIIKCGTPAIADYYRNRSELKPETVQQIESRIAESSIHAAKTYQSPSGNFTIHYETSGEHAVPPEDENQDGVPDYVEEVAAAADSSYSHEVQNIGYTNPIPSGQNYHIEILNLESYYGETISPGNYGGDTYIRIENDFSEGFPSNDDPEGDMIGAIKVTIAHELKHAVQYANNKWRGSAGSFNWSEMDATLMEEVVYDNVNDYYNYLSSSSSIFNSPEDGIPGAYWDVSWSLFFEEYYSSQFWVDVWEEIEEQPNMAFLDAIKNQAAARGDSFNKILPESFLWHLSAGPRLSPPLYGFQERQYYPAPYISQTISGILRDTTSTYSMSSLGSRFFEIEPTGMEQDQILITLKGDSTHFDAAAIAYFPDGTTERIFQSSISDNGNLVMKTPWSWKDIEKVGVVATNNSENNHMNVGISTESYQAEFVTLRQNFPNPFREETLFSFFLLREMHVELNVYDMAGRLVYTIIDEELIAGPHEIPFSASGLASGVYIYRLSTERKNLSRKMTIIK